MTGTETPVSATPVYTSAEIPTPATGRALLTNRILVRISGPGTDKFLQGQLSQNLEDVKLGTSPRAAGATPKGRAYCLTRLVRDRDDVLMDLPAELAEPIMAHLRKYMMLFRGTSMTVEDEGQIIGLLGDEAASALAGEEMRKLVSPGDSLPLDSGFLIRTENTAEGLSRFEAWQPVAGGLKLDSIPEKTLADWQASEIAAGVPMLSAATSESYVPQMLNWQHLGGVHFKKGCYTGQEVIARMHFLGQLKKSLFRFHMVNASSVPTPGTLIMAGERSVGEVVNAVGFSDGSCQLLAVVRHDSAHGQLIAEGQPDAFLQLQPLPYSVTEREDGATNDT
ncbi:folate-binding protein YgfZ [Marinobacter sp. 2_MG-2023]|uniref:CAF17-like 4Fe-4S cluster assembly/insertion protein YgfZ n=1 Tax=Marinobacter sp. 2_MG-2023 TaxID=3062679 RepID=UPI0026E3D4EC|nr:folate-binding protein [Marinobacter sp. 2_MG-2023]MDO6441097.1 folate-binding protein [Marinobacter sp. 2_MG-2023]